MSAFLDRADALAAYLATVDGLQSVEWEVDRRKNLESEFNKATSGPTGLGVITWLGGKNNNRDQSALRLSCQYTIVLFFSQLTDAASAATPDDIGQLTARALHHWFPDETPTKRQVRFEVTSLNAVEVPKDKDGKHQGFYAIYIGAESVVQMPSTPIPIIEPEP